MTIDEADPSDGLLSLVETFDDGLGRCCFDRQSVAGEELEFAGAEVAVGLAIAWKRKMLFHDILVEDVMPKVPGLRYAGQIFTCLAAR